MIVIKCDECGKELTSKQDRVGNRIKFKSKSGQLFEVIYSDEEYIWNAGHLCTDCVKKLIQSADRI